MQRDVLTVAVTMLAIVTCVGDSSAAALADNPIAALPVRPRPAVFFLAEYIVREDWMRRLLDDSDKAKVVYVPSETKLIVYGNQTFHNRIKDAIARELANEKKQSQ
jgi:hypothetical protein